MALTPRLDLRQAQSLVMTPQMQQAIKLLQLSSIELSAYVEQQLEQNPLLESDEYPTDGPTEDSNDSPLTEPEVVNNGEPQTVDTAVTDDTPLDPDAAFDIEDYDNIYDTDGFDGGLRDSALGGQAAGSGGQRNGANFDDDQRPTEQTLLSQPTLREHLFGQIAVDIDDPVDRLIATHLVDMLDDTGYLTEDLDRVAETLGCDVQQVEATLALAHQLDPAGIFARNLSECLALQLRERGRLDRPMQTMLDNLHLVASHDWAGLAKMCGLGTDRIAQMIAEIRTLNPKPAVAFDHSVAQPVVPDVIMRPQPNGSWVVELNTDTLPKVLINNQYFAHVYGAARSKEERHYINECMQSANWLVKTLHQRATTILKVSSEIVRQQDGFFVNGVHALRPLILRDVAEAIEMHESTVSRVTSNKFMATPRGTYELKYFFTQAIGGSNGGEAHSAESVRHRLKELVDSESANTVLSDDALAEILQKEGIDIARRTIAKYREALGISSSLQRRRDKRIRLGSEDGRKT